MTTTDVYAELSRVVLVGRALDEVLAEISDIAQRALPGAESTSITLMSGDRAWTAAYSGQMAYDADELQYETGHGPCMDAGRTGMLLLANDLANESRWPDYTPRVVKEVGAMSSLSAPLPFQGSTIGGLNNYSSKVDSFAEESVAVAREISAHIAIAVMNADAHAEAKAQAENLRRALESRKVIDMALGILMSSHHCTPEEAFAILSRASQNRNQKLRELAEAIVGSAMKPEGKQ
jgi:GAF domain-containing protein